MPKNLRTSLERMPSTGSLDSINIPSILRTSPETALSVSANERKKYNSAYHKASTSRKRRHIAKHLRRKTERRAKRKRGTRRSYKADVVAPPQKVVAKNPHMSLPPEKMLKEASDRRSNPDNYVRTYLSNKNNFDIIDRRKYF